ncbi:TNF receptor-associated factor 4-like [Corticium candelabrum]|uniref:TNF receptor-associated factor 4-like n=1 Tax=Corticium candelabrum TaxID=121492 RepID=UPI002E26EDE8|nr:TNF receptor-associated factor 4-like [Corticium candelabrum]
MKLFFIPKTQNQFLFTWKITNWHQHVKSSTAGKYFMHHISSSSFYVYPGYHMYISAYPNGYDISSKNYLSVFLFAIEGDLDKAIKWPFPLSFYFELEDQQHGGKSVRHQRSPPYGGALASSTCNSGCGFPKFASHEFMESRRYIKHDSICIKLGVHVKVEYDHR